ncbi:MAG: hypothetical protein ACTSXX_05520 [Candidatus Baldrarchaeia archaeon]
MKRVIVEVEVPEWVDEDELRREIREYVSRRFRYPSKLSADEMRRILGIKELTWDIEVPRGLEEEIMRLRKKRIW